MAKSLYEALEDCTYILANRVEQVYQELSSNFENFSFYEAVSEWNREKEYNTLMRDTEWYNLDNQEEFDRIKEENAESTLGEIMDTELISEELLGELGVAISEMDYPEIYQTFIIDENTRDILKSYGEIVWYNEDLDLHFWGVTHYGTHWSSIMGSQYPIT